jgi:hypothetical protein
LTDIISKNQTISRYSTLSLNNLASVSEAQNLLIEELKNGFRNLENKNIEDIHILELKAQSEGTANRIDVEKRHLTEILDSYGFNSSSEANKRVLYHKYRGKNAMGALIINESIFIIDNKSNQVVEVINLQ